MSPTCFEPRGFILRETGCVCSMMCFTYIGVAEWWTLPIRGSKHVEDIRD